MQYTVIHETDVNTLKFLHRLPICANAISESNATWCASYASIPVESTDVFQHSRVYQIPLYDANKK